MPTEPPPANTFDTILVRTYHSPFGHDCLKCVLILETCSRLWEPVFSSPFRTYSKESITQLQIFSFDHSTTEGIERILRALTLVRTILSFLKPRVGL